MRYNLKGLFRIPCSFNLRKYPFAIQTCVLHFDPSDNFDDVNFVMSKDTLPYGDIKLPIRKVVGEYEVIRCYSKLNNEHKASNMTVTLYIELAPFYSYHLLNSFLTSLLILLISFSTFLYRINDFNERIMVSLTALLVLTGFFSQANTVQTPYLKLLDIWYAVLIIFTFLNVVFVSALNALKFKLKANMVSCSAFKMYGEKDSVKKKILKYNYISFAILIVGFSIFLFFFVLFAADII